ncbi:MAG: TetR/AcrR family transcriptional regulator [Eubacteriaceae bacterium]|nr:TetR/AcrR family transcriptional regulator [Eubacteriaceae bacterium]
MESKQKIYECAKILFFEKGYKSVTKKQVAELSGCNQGLINYYFKELSNIASLINAERYSIISGYVKDYVTAKENPFLFSNTIDYYNHLIDSNYETAARFETEAFEEFIFGHAAYDYAFRDDILAQMGYQKPEMSDMGINKDYELISSLRMGLRGSYLSKVASGINIPFEDYMFFNAKMTSCALNMNMNEEEIRSKLEQSKKLAERIWEEHPRLHNPADFLYHKGILKGEPVLDLLNSVTFD